jgi:hypothetical protein
MPANRYRKFVEESLDRAAQARRPEDRGAWLLIAEDWIRLAVESDAAKQQRGTSPEGYARDRSRAPMSQV